MFNTWIPALWSPLNGVTSPGQPAFMPNHPKIGQYNAIVFKGIQGVETGRLSADKAADFVIDELQNELGKDVVIKN